MSRSHPFFILGHPRSGTSLLRSLLNAHPDVAIPPECGFLLWLYPAWKDAEWTPANKRAFAIAVSDCRKFETWGLNVDYLIQEVEATNIDSYLDAASSVYMAYAKAHGRSATLWGDKNNYYIREIAQIRTACPEARFIHIVRDVRDIICSFRELDEKSIDSIYRPRKNLSVEQITMEWITNNTAVESSLAAGSYAFVRYEDLVRQPSVGLNSIFQYLGIAKLPDISRTSHLKNLDEPVEFLQWKAKLNGPVDASSIGRYRMDLTAGEIAQVGSMAGRLLERYGYPA